MLMLCLSLPDVAVAICGHHCCCFLLVEVEDEDDVGEQIFLHSRCGCA